VASDPSDGRPPTIRTVAARAGVSKSLVSLVLQNSPRVSDEKRQAVLKAVAELGYRPDPVARSLAQRRTRTIGVILDDVSSPWWTEILDGLRLVLHQAGLRPLLADGRGTAAVVSLVLVVDPLVGVAAGLLWFGESVDIGTTTVAWAGLLLCGIALTQRDGTPARDETTTRAGSLLA